MKATHESYWLKLTSRDRPKSAPYPRLKNSKKTSKCQVFVYSSRKSKIFRIFFSKKLHTKKMDRVARRGSLPRAPGALTSHNAEKLKGGPFEVFQHPFGRKTWKNWRKQKFSFSGKNLTMPKKNWKGGPFGIFQHPFCRKTSKKCRGTLWGKNSEEKNSEKKCLAVPKKMKGGSLWSRPVWYVTRKNRKNLFGSVR